MVRSIVALALLSLTLSTVPAFAADADAEKEASQNLVWGSNIDWGMVPTSAARVQARPAVLPMLYASYAALQVYDVYSTRQAIGRGAREVNPVMQQVVGSPSAFWAMKATATVGTIAAAERLWKKNRTAAIAVLVVSNGVAAAVAARNARVLREQR